MLAGLYAIGAAAVLPAGSPPPPPVVIAPNPAGLPGTNAASGIVGGFEYFALILAVLGIAISAGVWAIGHHSSNPHQQSKGRTGTLAALAAAVLIGAGSALITWATGVGAQI